MRAVKWKQHLHLEPPIGWLNDPNGLCWFQNQYHVYFQYAPEDVNGGVKKCWGHYESPDMLHWNFTGTVLFPDTPADQDGVYSGSAIVNGDTLEIFYTGNVKYPGDHDYIYEGREANLIKVTSKDGHTMSPKQVLLRNCDYPDFCSCHVRDPKVWKQGDRYYMILGARTKDSKGCALIYQSKDLTHWEYEKVISAPDSGYMWECPDYFSLSDKAYLSASLQGVPHSDTRHQSVFSVGYFRCEGEPTNFTEWDYGFDFYAPQTFEAPDGRRILIGWMGMGDAYENPTVTLGWQHCLTLPRELSVADDGIIMQNPIKELESLRRECSSLEEDSQIDCGLPFELTGKITEAFELKIDSVNLRYDGELFSMQFDEGSGGGRTIRKVKAKHCQNIRIIADMSSLEIYLDNGRYVMSTRMYPEGENCHLKSHGLQADIYCLQKMRTIE